MTFNIDFCDNIISGNLEKLSFNISIVNFQYSMYSYYIESVFIIEIDFCDNIISGNLKKLRFLAYISMKK